MDRKQAAQRVRQGHALAPIGAHLICQRGDDSIDESSLPFDCVFPPELCQDTDQERFKILSGRGVRITRVDIREFSQSLIGHRTKRAS